MTSELKLCSWCGAEVPCLDNSCPLNTRPAPDVPELVTIGYTDIGTVNLMMHGHVSKATIVPKSGGDFDSAVVMRSQAAEIIAAEREKWQRSEQDKVGMLQHINELIDRAEAAEAKNAQYEAQEPVAYRYRHSEQEKWHYGETDQYWWEHQPLYASPAPAADLKTEMERLREVIENSGCPRPCNGRSDDTTVKECISYGECACVNGTALNPSELKYD